MKVSIIIPVYNVAPYVEACLQSVFNQTYQDIEILLVDDCGIDNSMDIVTNLIKGYDGNFEIKVLHHPHNKGLSAARNTGIKAASGEYIYFLDSDDTIPHDAINNLVKKVFEHPNVSFVIGRIKTSGYIKKLYPLLSKEFINNNSDIFIDYLQTKWNVMACNKLINRKFIQNNNIFFVEGIYHEDIDFSFKLAYYANSMACCYITTYNYQIRDFSISINRKIKNYTDRIFIIKNNFKCIKRRKSNEKEKKIISDYISTTVYDLCLDIIEEKNKVLNSHEKKDLIFQLKHIKNEFKEYNQFSPLGLIKHYIIKIPYPTLKILVLLYCYFRKQKLKFRKVFR